MGTFNYCLSDKMNGKNVLSLIEEHSIISITDRIGRLEYVSDGYCKILECNSNKLVGEAHKLLRSHLHSGSAYKDLWKTIKSGQSWNGILGDTSISGKKFWLDTTIIPIEIESKVKYLTIYKDITKLYAESIQLSKKNAKNEGLLKNMPFNLFYINRFGKILNTNKNFGVFNIDKLIGANIFDFIDSKWYYTFKNNLDAVFKGKVEKRFETVDFDSEGKKHTHSIQISPICDQIGQTNSAMVTFQKATDQDEKSESLKTIEAKYMAIFESTNVGIIVVADAQGDIVEWNKGAELAFGYRKAEILGRPLTVLMSKNFRKSNVKESIKAIKKIKNTKNTDTIEMSCLNKKGEEFLVELALNSWNMCENQFYCAMMVDITKRKQLEDKLKEKTRDLEIFLYRSAHDLKAPFSSAQGIINLMKAEKTKKGILHLVDMLDTTLMSGGIFSNNLVEASIISKKKYDLRPINFYSIVDNMLKMFRGATHYDDFEFNVDIDNSNSFRSNPELINSLFQNLIQNAIKYCKPPINGHVPRIDVIVYPFPEEVVIKIWDNGKGIDQKSIGKIFDLYYRANNDGITGNGLGLYVVKNIVEGLGGQIKVSSDVISGTCFTINLPNPKINS